VITGAGPQGLPLHFWGKGEHKMSFMHLLLVIGIVLMLKWFISSFRESNRESNAESIRPRGTYENAAGDHAALLTSKKKTARTPHR
jgi:hypothetical protein